MAYILLPGALTQGSALPATWLSVRLLLSCLAGICVTPDDSLGRALFHKQIRTCENPEGVPVAVLDKFPFAAPALVTSPFQHLLGTCTPSSPDIRTQCIYSSVGKKAVLASERFRVTSLLLLCFCDWGVGGGTSDKVACPRILCIENRVTPTYYGNESEAQRG